MKERLKSLDVLRGATICAMIVVNCAGSWSCVYAPLAHSPWNGLTFADVIFPAFLFMMGVSLYASLRKTAFQPSRPVVAHIVRRTVLLYVVGTVLYALDGVLHAGCWAALHEVRLSGVLERLALCYGISALWVLLCRQRHLWSTVGVLLLGYFVLLTFGRGFVYGPENILSKVDIALLGNHRYDDGGIDPEGLVSTLPALAHTLIGFACGRWVFSSRPLSERLNRLFVCGTVCLFAGFLLADICPINKKVWSPTFVAVTCGFSSLALGLLLWGIDGGERRPRGRFFEVVGVNPLFCYVASEVLYILADTLPFGHATFHAAYYAALQRAIGAGPFASLLYALSFLSVVWLVALGLYRRHIYIKL